MMRALSYLRVSTSDQAKRGGEAEGYSLPAQREGNGRKAEVLGAVIVEEYVEPGESGRTDQRPALQAMLKRIKENRDVDMVIVHKVNRWARNRYDDAILGATLRKLGVAFVSATENIDDTPSGRLMHGILATIAEFESANLATEVIKGCTQKAKAGGTPHMAPLGYLNVREAAADGREVRSIVLDPERAELVRWAFEAYATGDYSLVQLLHELTEKGLTTRPSRAYAAHPLHLSRLHVLLQNRYYMGIVRYRGVDYLGKHEPLIDPELFERVQVTLSVHRRGDKQRTHNHYLRGSLFCGYCKSRMGFLNAKGNGGYYSYYFCLGRQRTGGCPQPLVPLSKIEAAIPREYGRVRITESEAAELEKVILGALDKARAISEKESVRQSRRLAKLEAQRVKLLHAHYAGAVPIDLLQKEQARISREQELAKRAIEESQAHQAGIEENLGRALRLLTDCERLYPTAPTMVKRMLNQAFFERFDIGGGTEQVVVAEPFRTLLGAEAERRSDGRETVSGVVTVQQRLRARGRTPSFVSHGLSKKTVVGATGLEPVTSCVSSRRSNQAELRTH
jgi:site-specific DNA recombinase